MGYPSIRSIGRPLLAFAVLVVLAGCSAPTPLDHPAMRYTGVDVCHRQVTTTSAEAQSWFDQGLTFFYGFNHDEATRSFHQATLVDPDCSMAWWGLAIASGPDLNNSEMSARDYRRAFDAAQQAVATSAGATPQEQALAVQGRLGEAVRVAADLALVWERSDVEANSSCFCEPGAS